MIKALIDILRIPELRSRVFWTFGLLVVFRLGFWVFVPGIDADAHLTHAVQEGPLDWLLYTSRLTGGRFSSPVVFALGIMPYISASIIFSLLVKVFPRLEAIAKEGEQGRRLISRYTRYATVLLCVVQAMFLISSWRGTQYENGRSLVVDASVWMGLLQLMCLTAGSLFVMWLGEKITEFGIGNGSSVLIMAGIISDVPGAIGTVLRSIIAASEDRLPFEVTNSLLILGLFVAIVAGVVFITKGQRRIPIQHQRSVKGRRVYGGQRHYMPVKVNAAGVLPVIFASSLIMIPSLVIQNVAFSGSSVFHRILTVFADAFQYGGFLYLAAFVGLIIFFTYFWTNLMFNPVEIASNMKEYGSFIPGIRPGKSTAEYLERILKRITLAGAAFLCAIALVPNMIYSARPDVQYVVTQFLGGTGILIIVGVALDVVEKIEAQLLVRQYEGFMRSGENPKRGGGGPEKRSVSSV
jgi:preprotein translocase subunit SecY